MDIKIHELSRRFGRVWIFRELSAHIRSGEKVAITGSNGSGKSTLLKIISGILPAQKGKVDYILHEKPVPEEDKFKHLSYSAPYLDLYDQLTLKEMVNFHFSFQKARKEFDYQKVIEAAQLQKAENKKYEEFSSGMKQRLKNILALYSDTPLILLDEPCSNLDDQGKEWYDQCLKSLDRKRTLIIASNDPFEYQNCQRILDLEEFV